MPIYLFEHPETKEVVEVFQKMDEPHDYEVNGIRYDRVFTIPTASVSTKYDPFNAKDFVEKTRNKKGTVGDLWDLSKELSMKREEKAGKDDVKIKQVEADKKLRNNKGEVKRGNELR